MTKGPNSIGGMNQKSSVATQNEAGRSSSYTPIVNRNVVQEKSKIYNDPNMMMRKKSIGLNEQDVAQNIKFNEQLR